MNILFVTVHRFYSIKERNIYSDLLRYFMKQGHTIYTVSPAERRFGEKTSLRRESDCFILKVFTPNIQKTNYWEKLLSAILLPSLFIKAIKDYLPHVHFDLLIYSTPPITFTPLITWIRKKHNSFTYLLLKDIFPQNAVDLGILSRRNPIYWYFRRVEKRLYNSSDVIGCMSPANADFIRKKNSWIKAGKIEVCPNSIEPENYLIPDNSKREVRTRYNLPEEKTLFIFGGNLGKPQGIGFFLEMIAACQVVSCAFFVIVGSGTELLKVKNWIKKKGLSNVMLIPGLPKEEYDQLLQASDVGIVLLDRRFTIPNFPSRLLSYMEHSKPVLAATDVNTDLGKVITENGFGLWSEHGNSFDFKNNVSVLSEDLTLRQAMGIKGRLYLEENYNVSLAYDTIMKHFSEYV
jgi:glycosyltransferase involved in cell wall biosynthesis